MFLMSQKPYYAEGILNGMAADRITDVQRRFFKRFPLDMPETEEPSEARLSAVDDDAPDPEPQTPDEVLLSPEEYEKAMGIFRARMTLVSYRRKVSLPLPFATNNDKLTHDTANQTVVGISVRQGSSVVLQRRPRWQRPIRPSSLQTQRHSTLKTQKSNRLQSLGQDGHDQNRRRD